VHLFDFINLYISLYNFGQTLRWFDSLRFLEWLIIWNGGSIIYPILQKKRKKMNCSLYNYWTFFLMMSSGNVQELLIFWAKYVTTDVIDMYFEKPLGCAVVARTVENYHLCLSQYILYLTTLGIFSVPQICTRIPELHSVPQICRRISEFQCLWETQLARNLRTWLQEQ